MAEKTEKPSRRRLEEARKRGQVAQSRVLTGAGAVLGGILGLLASAPSTIVALKGWLCLVLTGQERSPPHALEVALLLLARGSALSLAGAVVGGAGLGLLTTGLQFHPEVILPKAERISPAKGFERLFRLRTLVDLLKAAVLAGALSVVVLLASRAWVHPVLATPALEPLAAHAVLFSALRSIIGKAAFALLVLGGLDYGLARFRHQKDLMMSREELKREHKDAEGDPHHRAKRRALQRALALGGPQRGVAKASAVVVNPTHIAVALRYDHRECDAPYLVAKGRDEEAFELRREAERLGIPVVRDIPLARSLIFYDVGEEIPEELYRAAAVVLKVSAQTQAQA
jgi:type III secretion protein U